MPEIFLGRKPIFDSETWHVRACEALHLAEAMPLSLGLIGLLAHHGRRIKDPRLEVEMSGIQFESPVMVGAGWDKGGRAVKGLHALGFAGVEVGSVLAFAQEGNPKPRQFMIAPGVAINRLGFNTPSGGLEEVAHNLNHYDASGIPIGISIGKNKDVLIQDAPEAHARVAARLDQYARYFVIDVSSPNTPGLRALQKMEPLTDIVQAVKDVTKKPVFVKISPDLTLREVDNVIRVVKDNGLTGIVATNTTDNSEIKAKYGWQDEAGGLSGDDPDFRRMATEKIAHIHTAAKDLTVIGVGGIKDWKTALEKIQAGATLVQVVTAIRGVGPTVAARIHRGLIHYMEQNGVKRISELVGRN